MPAPQGTSRNKKRGGGSGRSGAETAKPSATSVKGDNPPGTITIKVRSSANKETPTTPEEFGSVWFRNHNPNATAGSGQPAKDAQAVAPSPTIVSQAPKGRAGSQGQLPPPPPPPHPSTVYDLSSIPPWARYRLPPVSLSTTATATTTATAGTAAIPVDPQQPNSSAPCASTAPAVVVGSTVTRLPTQLYPCTVDGLSTEMYDFVLAMRLTTAERGAREALKGKIEKVVGNLWPSPNTNEASELVSAPTPLPIGRRVKPTPASILSSFSTPTLASLVSSPRESRPATPVPAEPINARSKPSSPTASTPSSFPDAQKTSAPDNSNTTTNENSNIQNNFEQPSALSTSQPLSAGAANATAACEQQPAAEGPHTNNSEQPLSAKVIMFGSYALDLATPCSDLDLSVVFQKAPSSAGGMGSSSFSTTGAGVDIAADSTTPAPPSDPLSEEDLQFQRFVSKVPSFEVLRLRELAEALHRFDECLEVKVLEECRVPVVHVIDLPTGISADISVNMQHMVDVVGMQKGWLADEEHRERTEGGDSRASEVTKVRALIILTKLALRQWGVSCSFTGGLSSTGVYLLVERYLREGREAGCVPSPLPPIGRLVIDFWAYLSSDMFQQGFLAADVFHISNKNNAIVPSLPTGSIQVLSNMPSHTPSMLSSPREVSPHGHVVVGTPLEAGAPAFVPSPNNLSPVALDAPGSFPTVPTTPVPPTSADIASRTMSNILTASLPDVTRRCTRMAEIQFFFRHSATTLEQLVAPGPKNVWSLPPTPLSSVLTDLRQCPPPSLTTRRVRTQCYRPYKNVPRDASESGAAQSTSDRSSTPGASSNGSDVAISPSVKSASSSPVKFTSSLKDFVGAPCFVPKKFGLSTPPPEYQPPTAQFL